MMFFYVCLSILGVLVTFLETAFLNFQTIRERKIENKKIASKKGFLLFLLSMYVFLCVCVFVVCSSVIALQTSSFNIGGRNFNIHTYQVALKKTPQL